MKRNNLFRYILELIVVLGYLVIGVTVLTYIFQNVPMLDHVFIGFIVLSLGVFGFTDFFTLKYAAKIKSIQSLVRSILMIALGILFIVVDFDNNLLCILYGLFSIGFALISISTAVLNMSRQPLLNGIRLIISITEIVFSILLIIRTVNSLYAHMAFIGIASVVMAVTLLIEFMVHRYQRI